MTDWDTLDRGPLLSAWLGMNLPSKGESEREELLSQVEFVQGQLLPMFDGGESPEASLLLRVVGSYDDGWLRPVYGIHTDSLEVHMCGYLYHWIVSVKCERAVPDSFFDLFNRSQSVGTSHCGGFNQDWILGSFRSDRSAFTVRLRNQQDVFTFMFILTRELGIQGALPHYR